MSKIQDLKKAKRELKELKENFDELDKLGTYNRLFSLCDDIDCQVSGLDLAEFLNDEQYIPADGEDMYYCLDECHNDITRLRYFIGDTYDDDLYQIDGYGNLKNVTASDLEDVIDTIIEKIDREIEDEKQM